MVRTVVPNGVSNLRIEKHITVIVKGLRRIQMWFRFQASLEKKKCKNNLGIRLEKARIGSSKVKSFGIFA